MLNPAVIDKFNEFKSRTGKYNNLDIEDIEFEEKKLSQISSITMGQSPKGDDLNSEGDGLPFYQGKTEFTDVYIGKPTKWASKSKKLAYKDDILISMRAPAGAVNIATETISIGRGLAAIKVNDGILNQYVFPYLKSIEERINYEKDSGGFYSSMTKDELYDFNINIPRQLDSEYTSIRVQEIIVEFMDAFKLWKNKILELASSVDKKSSILDAAFLNEIFKGSYSD